MLTLVQGDPEEDILRVRERDEQTWARFVLFISCSINSNRADYSFT